MADESKPDPGEPGTAPPSRPPPVRRGPRSLTIFVVAVAAIAAGVGAWFVTPGPPEPPGQEAGVALTDASIGGPFSLIDHHSKRVSDADFRGRYMLVFFGFTHCPDVCPSTLRNISLALDHLDRAADEIRAVFITVDPERDGPEDMAAYVELFDSRILGLTGTPEEIVQATAAYRVFAAKVPIGEAGRGLHGSHGVYLSNGQGR